MSINTASTASSSIGKAIATSSPNTSSQKNSNLSASGVAEAQDGTNINNEAEATTNSGTNSTTTASKTVSKGYSSSPTSQASPKSAPLAAPPQQPQLPPNNSAMAGLGSLGQAGQAMMQGLKALSEWNNKGAQNPGKGNGNGSSNSNNKANENPNKAKELDPKEPEDQAKITSANAIFDKDPRKQLAFIYTNDKDTNNRDATLAKLLESRTNLDRNYQVTHVHLNDKGEILINPKIEQESNSFKLSEGALSTKDKVSPYYKSNFESTSLLLVSSRKDGKVSESTIDLSKLAKDAPLLDPSKTRNLHHVNFSDPKTMKAFEEDTQFQEYLQSKDSDLVRTFQNLIQPDDSKLKFTPEGLEGFSKKLQKEYDEYLNTSS